jgi:hypothetical protein
MVELAGEAWAGIGNKSLFASFSSEKEDSSKRRAEARRFAALNEQRLRR